MTCHAMTISEFCEAHRLSRSYFYVLVREGRGPKLMRLRSKTLISVEAAADWRQKMEQIEIAKKGAGDSTGRRQ
jgi:hypothetical protein